MSFSCLLLVISLPTDITLRSFYKGIPYLRGSEGLAIIDDGINKAGVKIHCIYTVAIKPVLQY